MISFVADVHLGKLARLLRMLGFDCLYSNTFTTAQLKQLATGTGRVLLSRNQTFTTGQSLRSFIVISEEPKKQLLHVLAAFGLFNSFQPFTKCITCNGELKGVSKDKVIPFLKENTITYYDVFWQCSNCGNVYWKGAHYKRMMQFITGIYEVEQ